MAKKTGGGKGKNGKGSDDKNRELRVGRGIKNDELLKGQKPQVRGKKFTDVIKSNKTNKKFTEIIKSEKPVNEEKKDTQKPVGKKVEAKSSKEQKKAVKATPQKPANKPVKKEGKMARLAKATGKITKSVATKNPLVKAGVAITKGAKNAFLKSNGHIPKNKPDNTPSKAPNTPKPSKPSAPSR